MQYVFDHLKWVFNRTFFPDTKNNLKEEEKFDPRSSGTDGYLILTLLLTFP